MFHASTKIIVHRASVNNSDIKIMPVANLKITATSQRLLPIKRQMITPIEIGGEKYELKLYVVPKFCF